MSREIRLNAFDMNCVGHQSPGLWAHPRDRSWQYKDLEYWTDLAKILERGKFDGLFIADVLGIYDVYNGNGDAAIRQATQVPVNDPLSLIAPMALVTEPGFWPDRVAVVRTPVSVCTQAVDPRPPDQGPHRLEHRHLLSGKRRQEPRPESPDRTRRTLRLCRGVPGGLLQTLGRQLGRGRGTARP